MEGSSRFDALIQKFGFTSLSALEARTPKERFGFIAKIAKDLQNGTYSGKLTPKELQSLKIIQQKLATEKPGKISAIFTKIFQKNEATKLENQIIRLENTLIRDLLYSGKKLTYEDMIELKELIPLALMRAKRSERHDLVANLIKDKKLIEFLAATHDTLAFKELVRNAYNEGQLFELFNRCPALLNDSNIQTIVQNTIRDEMERGSRAEGLITTKNQELIQNLGNHSSADKAVLDKIYPLLANAYLDTLETVHNGQKMSPEARDMAKAAVISYCKSSQAPYIILPLKATKHSKSSLQSKVGHIRSRHESTRKKLGTAGKSIDTVGNLSLPLVTSEALFLHKKLSQLDQIAIELFILEAHRYRQDALQNQK